MGDKQAFLREVRARTQTPEDPRVIAPEDRRSLEDDQCMVPLLWVHVPPADEERTNSQNSVHSTADDDWRAELGEWSAEDPEGERGRGLIREPATSGNEYVVVMSLASSTLWRVLGTQSIAGCDAAAVISIFEGIVRSVHRLHGYERIHGDLKPQNIVNIERSGRRRTQEARQTTDEETEGAWAGSTWKLIDLDRSNPIEGEVTPGSDGYAVPPELAAEIWSGSMGGQAEHSLSRRRPMGNGLSRSDSTQSRRKTNGLFKSDYSLDMWSLGCILFELVTGNSLFMRNLNDDSINEVQRCAVLNWGGLPKDRCSEVFANCKTVFSNEHQPGIGLITVGRRAAAVDLIGLLLEKDPAHRPSTTQVLQHPFLWKEDPMYKLGRQLRQPNCAQVDIDQLLKTVARTGPHFNTGPLIIFSYQSKQVGFLQRLCRLLHVLHIDTFDGTMVASGRDWRQEYFSELADAIAFVPIISHSFMASSACAEEVAEAFETNKPILPILFHEDAFDMDKPDGLDQALQEKLHTKHKESGIPAMGGLFLPSAPKPGQVCLPGQVDSSSQTFPSSGPNAAAVFWDNFCTMLIKLHSILETRTDHTAIADVYLLAHEAQTKFAEDIKRELKAIESLHNVHIVITSSSCAEDVSTAPVLCPILSKEFLESFLDKPELEDAITTCWNGRRRLLPLLYDVNDWTDAIKNTYNQNVQDDCRRVAKLESVLLSANTLPAHSSQRFDKQLEINVLKLEAEVSRELDNPRSSQMELQRRIPKLRVIFDNCKDSVPDWSGGRKFDDFDKQQRKHDGESPSCLQGRSQLQPQSSADGRSDVDRLVEAILADVGSISRSPHSISMNEGADAEGTTDGPSIIVCVPERRASYDEIQREQTEVFVQKLQEALRDCGITLLNPGDAEWFHVCRGNPRIVACVPLLSAAFCKSKLCEDKLTYALHLQGGRHNSLQKIVPIVYKNDVNDLMQHPGQSNQERGRLLGGKSMN